MIEELNGDFLQWLRGFYFVATTGSVRKAAELMHRNPSTISYQLRSLENELGVPLFDRYKKSLRITPEGKNLLNWTKSVFETLKNMRSTVGNLAGELQGQIKMAITLPISNFAVGAVSEFIRQHPKVRLLIERGLSADLRQAVEEYDADFALLPMIIQPDADFDIVFKARPLLVMPRDNPWHVPPIPEVKDIKGLPFVSFWSRSGGDEYYDYMIATGIGDFTQKNAVLRINNYHMIMRYVWQKMGVTIMDEICFQATNYGADWKNLTAIPLDHILPDNLYGILTRRGKQLSPQAQALIAHLHSALISLTTRKTADVWRQIRQEDDKKRVRQTS